MEQSQPLRFLPTEEVHALDDAERGRRVRLIRCTDEWTHLQPGEEGTIDSVDAVGTRHVRWDSGSHLGLVPDADEWELIS